MNAKPLTAVAVISLALGGASLAAQPPLVTAAYAYQGGDIDPSNFATSLFYQPISGCENFRQGARNQTLTSSVTCLLNNGGWGGTAALASPGTETATARAFAQFDPTAGTFKTAASLDANGFGLSRFVPTYDQTGQRVYTNELRPDRVGAYAQFGLNDVIAVLGPITPARVNLALDWTGTLHTPMSQGASFMTTSLALSHLQFCIGPFGTCTDGDTSNDDQLLYAFADVNADGITTFQPLTYAAYIGPNGGMGQSLTFTGTATTVYDIPNDPFSGTTTTIVGTFHALNVPAHNIGFDFDIFGWNWAEFRHQSANGPDCDWFEVEQLLCGSPASPWVPSDAYGVVQSDFSHTLSLASYQAFDAQGRDITNGISLSFGSGMYVPPDPTSPPFSAAPEPATLALVASGLLALGTLARRRRAAT